MKYLKASEVRQMFLDFFISKKHMIEPGASLVPINDPSLLWINSGVAALKKYLDGRETPKCNRIANAQKCIRTNDIENVGRTARHHTFFEMLGNWSIGDYFKKEALEISWEFLTSPKWIGFDPKRIYVTVYPDDTDSYNIWTKDIGLDPSHILKSKDNFWQIGEGPCGPDSEIYYDRGPEFDPDGLGEKLFFEEIENDRYVELWNNVFSQYDAKEGVDRKDFKELPQKNIDTGMGLERLTCFIQGGETNFDTDLFLPIIHKIEEYSNIKYKDNKMAYRVMADHIRTCTFALSDGATFSNEGRGYVLRRVIRRAMRYARNIGINKPFLYEIVDTVVSIMNDFYPYLEDKKEFVKKLIKKEEESFIVTLANGEKLLNQELANVKDGVLKGDVIFKLYDTYGFPKEMTMESCAERNIKYDLEGFDKCMAKQKEMARNARSEEESMQNQSIDLLNLNTPFEFTGYEKIKDSAKVVALFKNGKKDDSIEDEGEVVFDHSCFYATSGGQVADNGIIINSNSKAYVKDVIKAPNGQFLHKVKLEKGSIKLNDSFDLNIDEPQRVKTMANHSSLHLLQSALRKVLGDHVAQAGSYVSKDYARFDFSHYEKISDEDLRKIEELVNSYIFDEIDVHTDVLDVDEAKKTGAIALFDEKYGDKVRVVSMGNVSKEFCGGTHVSNTSKLGLFKIVSEESIGSGIRRIECVTKDAAYKLSLNYQNDMNTLKDNLKLKNTSEVITRVNLLKEDIYNLENTNSKLNNRLINLDALTYLDNVKDNGKFKYLVIKAKDLNYNLKDFSNILRNEIDEGLVFILNETSDKYQFVSSVGKNATSNSLSANDLIKFACSISNGKGGGKADLAQGAGENKGNSDEIISAIINKLS